MCFCIFYALSIVQIKANYIKKKRFNTLKLPRVEIKISDQYLGNSDQHNPKNNKGTKWFAQYNFAHFVLKIQDKLHKANICGKSQL